MPWFRLGAIRDHFGFSALQFNSSRSSSVNSRDPQKKMKGFHNTMHIKKIVQAYVSDFHYERLKKEGKMVAELHSRWPPFWQHRGQIHESEAGPLTGGCKECASTPSPPSPTGQKGPQRCAQLLARSLRRKFVLKSFLFHRSICNNHFKCLFLTAKKAQIVFSSTRG